MSNEQSGYMSNAYAYEPYTQNPDLLKLGNIVGGAIGNVVGQQFGVIGSVAGTVAGAYAGEEITNTISNADTIVNNAKQFMNEIVDWRSAASAMEEFKGGSWSP